jgi:putative ABC transport system permease protein
MFYPYVNTADPPLPTMNLVVKTAGDPASMTNTIVNELRKADRLLAITEIRTMDDLRASALEPDRFNLWLLGSFALLALLLAALGVYGVMSYAVTRRTQEIGIRRALGAQTVDVLRLVLKNGMTLSLIGVAIGLAGAFALSRVMASLLFEVTPTDAMTYAIVSGGLLAVALLACYIPARRATKVDPLVALRYE